MIWETRQVDRSESPDHAFIGLFDYRKLSISKLVISLGTVIFISGCSVPNIGGESIYGARIYRPNPQGYLTAGRSRSQNIATVVTGNPYGIPDISLATTVGASMSTAVESYDARFAVLAGETVRPRVSTIVAFNPPLNSTASGLCTVKSNASSVPSTGDVYIVMALCLEKDPVSMVRGKLSRENGPQTRTFTRFFRQMTSKLFAIGVNPIDGGSK